jgi:L-ascorbate metabolism protein UlaG (beta-lactamase superfamily)
MARNRYYEGPVSDHFDGTRFFMPDAPADKSTGDLLRFLARTRYARWPRRVDNPPPSPVHRRVGGSALRVTTIGHASHLLQTRGLNILVDPVWSRRASPFAFAGPERVAPPGLPIDALPPLDAILITHNHYDHLDLATLETLRATNPCPIITPLGNDSIIRRRSAAFDVRAYDWGERVPLSAEVAVTLVPCHHWSARWLGDRRMALWAAFLIETPDGPIYHVGDTAWRGASLFEEIPRRFGAPRLAILPIGAYEPRWFMRDQHVEPSESVRVFTACQARIALAHHWGTFQLTAEAMEDPPARLAVALREAGIAPDRFRVQRPGQAFDVPLAIPPTEPATATGL